MIKNVDHLINFWVEKRADDGLLDFLLDPDGLRSVVKEKADSELNEIGDLVKNKSDEIAGVLKNKKDDIYGSIESKLKGKQFDAESFMKNLTGSANKKIDGVKSNIDNLSDLASSKWTELKKSIPGYSEFQDRKQYEKLMESSKPKLTLTDVAEGIKKEYSNNFKGTFNAANAGDKAERTIRTLSDAVKEKVKSSNSLEDIVKNWGASEKKDFATKAISDKESALSMAKKLVTDERSKAWAAGDKNLSSEIASHYAKTLGTLGLGGLLGVLGLQNPSEVPEMSKSQKLLEMAKKNKGILAALGLGGLGAGGLAASAFGSRE